MTEKSTQKGRRRVDIAKARRTALFLAASTLLILAGGLLTLFWSEQQRQHARAEDPTSVVGPPTLPAATVEQILEGSPMAGTGAVIEDAARQNNIDDAFALGVWWAETNFGAAGVGLGYHNPGGVRGSSAYAVGGGGYTVYPTYADAVYDWFSIVKSRYVNRGLTTVYGISGPYVGTSSSGSWANKVYNLMSQYRGMVPPTPTPTPSPTPSPTPTPTPHDREQEQRFVTTVLTPKPVATPAAQQTGGTSAAQTFTMRGSQGLFAGGGLFLALLLFGWGCLIRLQSRRDELASEPVTGTLALELLPRYTNELSLMPTAKMAMQRPESVTAALDDGLLTSYGTETQLRRVWLHQTQAQTEQLTAEVREAQTESLGDDNRTFNTFPIDDDTTIRQEPTTEGFAWSRPGLSLPGRVREPVRVGNRRRGQNGDGERRAGGLLGRYGDNTLKKGG